MPPRIFIGGTVRSGTSILYQALGRHTAIHSLPTEMRFLIDPDGLMNLIDALTVHYSLVQAREMLFRFERMMRIYLCHPWKGPYPGFNFPAWLGGQYYWQRLDQFCSELVDGEFDGTDWQVEPTEGRLVIFVKRLEQLWRGLRCYPFLARRGLRELRHGLVRRIFFARPTLPRTDLKIVKYFPGRAHLVELAASFVDDLFLHAAHERGKQTWCEKTPLNFLHVDFIWELFPNSVFIHIKRDPRGVVHSTTKQFWGPSDVRQACLYLRGIYERWFDLKRTLETDKYKYLEIKLEDLCEPGKSVLEQITSLCGLENNFENLPDITPDKVNYWRQTMTSEEKQLVNEMLGPYISQMGYELEA